ncbi:hypothetical protein TrRE_jg2946, partial [Triparma retinervis]
MSLIIPQLDHARCVHLLRSHGEACLFLAIPYMKEVQSKNISAVNTVLNELYLLDKDYESLQDSIDGFDNFDQIDLAQQIESHELLEFRRIAAYLYRKNKRWNQYITLYRKNKRWDQSITLSNVLFSLAVLGFSLAIVIDALFKGWTGMW